MALFGRHSAEDHRKAREWAEWFAQRNPLAIVSFVLGVFSFIEFGVLIIFGVAGIAAGVVGLKQISRPVLGNARNKGRILAWSGIVLSAASLVIAIAFLRVLG